MLSHPSLHPKNLAILKKKKSWALHLDVLILSDAGNVYDAIFLASRAALWDTKVPRTKSVEYKAPGGSKAKGSENKQANMDIDVDVASGFETRKMLQEATDFELPDYWDEGEPLDGRNRWPIGVTLNVVRALYRDCDVSHSFADSSGTFSGRKPRRRSRDASSPTLLVFVRWRGSRHSSRGTDHWARRIYIASNCGTAQSRSLFTLDNASS